MSDRYDHMYLAATRYYVQGETMEAISRDLGVSRSTVSRLISSARESGLVRITIAESAGSHSPVARALADAFGVRVHMVPSRAPTLVQRTDQVAQRAATLLADIVQDDQTIGVAWGVTMAAVTRHLPRRSRSGTTVVQMNGGASHNTSGIPWIREILQSFGDAFGSDIALFPVPAFFDYAATKQAMWRERSVQRVLAMLSRLDVAVFGVGSLTGAVASHVYAAGYIGDAERAALVADGVVGDICTVLLREDGTFADIEANRRATGPTPAELSNVPRRLCVVADPLRAPAVLGALRAGAVTDLVIDDVTARTTLARIS
ncbi:MAG: sugar-binding domain-containing protein [Propioniciclava sp.]|uniref:sugar-binding transcriptional regulator n=1 Tax=Propioniciclava sp. TaxID=2038686 RepID=UPI0039E27428